jgi:hypothetical protein
MPPQSLEAEGRPARVLLAWVSGGADSIQDAFGNDCSMNPGQGIWVLFDYHGHVLRSGEESFEPADLRRMLEQRYPRICVSTVPGSRVVARDERPLRVVQQRLQLYCAWLAHDSPLPEMQPTRF